MGKKISTTPSVVLEIIVELIVDIHRPLHVKRYGDFSSRALQPTSRGACLEQRLKQSECDLGLFQSALYSACQIVRTDRCRQMGRHMQIHGCTRQGQITAQNLI